MHKTLLRALLLLCLSTVALGQPSGHPARAVFEQWLAAFNPGDASAIQAFIRRYERKYSLQEELDFRESVGRLEVLEMSEPSATALTVLVRGTASDSALLVTLAVDPTDPARIATFQLEGTETPERFRIPRLPLPEVLKQARSRMASLQAKDKLAGVLLAAQDDRVLFTWAGGLADRRAGVPILANTRFRIASLGKMFTAVAVLQLVEAGKLGLDEPVGKYLSGPPLTDAVRKVTLRQLLNHTSGLGEIFDDAFRQNAGRLRTPSDYLAQYGQQPPAFEPGTQEQYSNFGYILLGAVLESVSGLDYPQYVKKKVFLPSGMDRSGFEPEVRRVAGLARPYTQEKGAWVDAAPSLPWRGTPAGGGYSTAADLLRFAQALRAGRLLSPRMLDIATSGQNLKGWYGFGFMVEGQGPVARYGHEGGAPGMNAALAVLPMQGYTVVGLGNLDPSSIGQIVNFIANRLPLRP